MNRRELLQVLATTSVSAHSSLAQVHEHPAPSRIDIRNYKPRFLRSDEYEFLKAFADTLIPTDDESGGAIDAGVPYYIDTVLLHAKSPVQEQWQQGLRAVAAAVRRRSNSDLPALTPEQREQAVQEVLLHETGPVSNTDRFIVLLKQSIIDAYCVSEVGLQHFHYAGNTAIEEFSGCTHLEHKP